MKDSVRKERSDKLTKTLEAAIDHLQRGLAAMEDANLYSDDDQEHHIDTAVNRLEDVISDIRLELLSD